LTKASDKTIREVNAAREREDREDRVILFPVRLDEVAMEASQPWVADVRRARHIWDFGEWCQPQGIEERLTDCSGT
jgi:hypothetical protein